jgi:benzoyl-CoA-dihydrodiol lyase
VATLLADFDENAGLRPGYKLKLNSYDLGVDIELNDALNRIRFEHPEVRTVVSPAPRTRCSARAPTSSCWACPATPGR